MDAIDDIEEISRGVRPSSHGAGSAVSASPMDDAAKRGMYRNLRWLVNQASDMLARKISTRAAEAIERCMHAVNACCSERNSFAFACHAKARDAAQQRALATPTCMIRG